MDILEANLSQLLPAPALEENSHAPWLEEETGVDIWPEERDEFLECLKVLAASAPSWNCNTPGTILEATRLTTHFLVVCLRDIMHGYAGQIEAARTSLDTLAEILQRACNTPNMFQTPREHTKFREEALSLVKTAKKIFCAANNLVAVAASAKQGMAAGVRPAEGDVETGKGHWPAWCGNSVPFGSDEQRRAVAQKKEFKTSAAFLPRAGYAIVERWRTDVDAVVDDILKINRSREAEAQSSTQQSTYLTTIDEGKENFLRTRAVVVQPGEDLYSKSMNDASITPAQALGSFEGMEPEAPGQQPLGVWETTFMNVARMREARDERASKLEDFGRAW